MAHPQDPIDQEQPLVSHLLELRDRLLRMLAAILVGMLLLFPFANDIYIYVANPLMSHLPAGTSMIATGVATPFLTPFKLSLVAAVFLAMPWILYQFWAFVAPGLYRHEQRLILPLLASSTLLFYLGMLFAYYVVFPLVFAFFVGTAPEGVAVMTDISQYLDFVLTLFFAFGIAFEVPVATVLMVWMGVTTPEALVEKRPYIIVGAFVIGMLLTPPDVISQTLLAVPMWLLFELGVVASRFLLREKARRERAEAEAEGYGSHPAPAPELLVGAEIAAGDHREPGRFVPLSPEEMDRELDAAIEAEKALDAEHEPLDPVEAKLHRVQALREWGQVLEARALLYQVLEEGDADQRRVARDILDQLDQP